MIIVKELGFAYPIYLAIRIVFSTRCANRSILLHTYFQLVPHLFAAAARPHMYLHIASRSKQR